MVALAWGCKANSSLWGSTNTKRWGKPSGYFDRSWRLGPQPLQTHTLQHLHSVIHSKNTAVKSLDTGTAGARTSSWSIVQWAWEDPSLSWLVQSEEANVKFGKGRFLFHYPHLLMLKILRKMSECKDSHQNRKIEQMFLCRVVVWINHLWRAFLPASFPLHGHIRLYHGYTTVRLSDPYDEGSCCSVQTEFLVWSVCM